MEMKYEILISEVSTPLTEHISPDNNIPSQAAQ